VYIQSSTKKVWRGSDGLSTSVDTPQTERARQLQEMYNVLLNDLFNEDERIDVLMSVKNTVKVGTPPANCSEMTIMCRVGR